MILIVRCLMAFLLLDFIIFFYVRSDDNAYAIKLGLSTRFEINKTLGFNFTKEEKEGRFFHLHVGKTAGSEFVKQMGRRCTDVCGNKVQSKTELPQDCKYGAAYSEAQNQLTRKNCRAEQKPIFPVNECKFISNECGWSWWGGYMKNMTKKEHRTLLVPCREPWQLLMSMCNFHHLSPNELDPQNMLKSCTFEHDVIHRYSSKMLKDFDSVYYLYYSKAFNLVDSFYSFIPRHPPYENLYPRLSNSPRDKEKEVFSREQKEEILRMLYDKTFDYVHDCERFIFEGTRTLTKIMIL